MFSASGSVGDSACRLEGSFSRLPVGYRGYVPLIPLESSDCEPQSTTTNFLSTLLQLPDLELLELLAKLEHFRPVILQRALAVAPFAAQRSPLPPAVPPHAEVPKLSVATSGNVQTIWDNNGLAKRCFQPARPPKDHEVLVEVPEPKLCFLPKRMGTASTRPSGSTQAPLVQFTAFVYFFYEDEGFIEVDVMRMGDLSEPSEVAFRTRDGSAISGTSYEAVDTPVYFAKGQDLVTVQVPLICSEDWDTTTELGVELYAGKVGLQNAELGRYLWNARVKIIDNDCFPSNKNAEYLRDGVRVEDAPNFSVFIEYVKFNWGNAVIRERSIKIILIGQLHNLYSFIHLFINVYLVDYVLNPDTSNGDLVLIHSKSMTLLAIIVANLLPYVFLHALDYRKAERYGVGGQSRERLQVCLLRKFLNYDTESRSKLSSADLVMSMTRDSALLAADGYANVLEIVKELGSLTFSLAYQFIAPLVFNRHINWLAFMPLLIFPCTMYCFLVCRSALTDELLDLKNKCQNNLVSMVDETVNIYPLISDYNQRERCIKEFDVHVKEYNSAHRTAGCVLMNNHHFSRWLSLICLAFWTIFGGTRVLEHEVSLGMFLANVNILGMIGSAWGGIYQISLDVMTMFPSQENVVRAMNLPTDVASRRALNILSRRESRLLVESMSNTDLQDGGPPIVIDRMCIEVGDIPFVYSTTNSATVTVRRTSLNISGIARIALGEVAFLMGPRGGGKGSVLKIIGGEILPKAEAVGGRCDANKPGRCFVPPHLWTLHVSSPIFFGGSLLANLSFGVASGDEDGTPERVAKVCALLGIEDDVMEHLKTEESLLWSDVFSTTQCQLLSVARALVANPEILCIHQPTQLFSEAVTKTVMDVLRGFVDERGVQDNHAKDSRRLRTLIMTTVQTSSLKLADRVFHISKESGIVEASPSDIDTIRAHGASALTPCNNPGRVP